MITNIQDPFYPNSFSANFAAVFPELANIVNSCVEGTVILNYITKYNNKFLEEYSK